MVTAPPDRTTIIAVGSPPGRSPRGIIRLSGPAVPSIISDHLSASLPPRNPTPTRLTLGDLALPVLVAHCPAPHSYTAEHTLELQLPGNPALLERVLHLLLSRPDLHLAEPGQFTRRAYTAGRIDLTRVEGIAATISAVSDTQLAAARLLRTGSLGAWAEQLVQRLAQSLALVEAGIDFTDQDDVVPITPADLHDQLKQRAADLADLTTRSRTWNQLEDLPRVVLAGRPNAGKSTLFNALLGRERAVATPVAGTTRDVLTEPLRLHIDGRDAEVMLVDIAGLEVVGGQLEADTQSAARAAIAAADLVLHLSPDTFEHLDDILTPNTPVLHITTMSDQANETIPGADIAVSAHTGSNLGDLRHLIASRLRHRAVTLAGQTLALQPRHAAALRDAADALDRATRAFDPAAPSLAAPELVALEMRSALDALGTLGGNVTPDDVIGRVFATFCVGK